MNKKHIKAEMKCEGMVKARNTVERTRSFFLIWTQVHIYTYFL